MSKRTQERQTRTSGCKFQVREENGEKRLEGYFPFSAIPMNSGRERQSRLIHTLSTVRSPMTFGC